MIKIENILICGLVISLFVVGCEKKKEQVGQVETKVEEGKKIIQQGKQEAVQTKESMTEQSGEKVVKEESGQAESKVESAKDKIASIIKELIAKAKALLNEGKYGDAASTAQEVLSKYDSESQEAKDIFTTATEKLKAVATEKGEAIKEGVTEKLKGLGK